jgi:beta-glucosidase
MDAAGSIIASVSIQNTGKVDGDEVVQLYIRDLISSVTRPVKELKGFKRVHIPAGKSVVVDFKITAQELAFWRKDMTFGVEAGNFKIFIGTNSVDVKEAEFSLTESSEVKL